jgi:hypothetical protein
MGLLWDTPTDMMEFDSGIQQSFENLVEIQGPKGSLWHDGSRTFGYIKLGSMSVVLSSDNRAAIERVMAGLQP